MLRIHSVSTPRANVELGFSPSRDNWVDVLTGPNGSGKTEILTALCNNLSRRPSKQVRVIASGAAKRIIAQTFSPFSRFPRPRRDEGSLSKIYKEERLHRDVYTPIGFFRGARASGGLAKEIVEQSLYRLSENLDRTTIVGRVLQYLGFRPEIELQYSVRPYAEKMLRAAFQRDRAELVSQIASRNLTFRMLKREIASEGLDATAELIGTSVEVLSEFDLDSAKMKLRLGLLGGSPSSSYAELQALAVLRRFNLLQLSHCQFRRDEGAKIELSHASSGQQQLLCSLFGLAGEIEDDSLVLIDEPELSLHPTWQIAFLEHLQNILQVVSGCHVVIATHSPLIVQKAQQLRYGVKVLAKEGPQADAHEVENPDASIEEALIDVFESPIPRSLYLSDEIIRAVNDSDESPQNAAKQRDGCANCERFMRIRQNPKL